MVKTSLITTKLETEILQDGSCQILNKTWERSKLLPRGGICGINYISWNEPINQIWHFNTEIFQEFLDEMEILMAKIIQKLLRYTLFQPLINAEYYRN